MARKGDYLYKRYGKTLKSSRTSRKHISKILASLFFLVAITSFVALTYYLNESVTHKPQMTTLLASLREEVFIGKLIKGSVNDKASGLVLEDRDCIVVRGSQLTCTAVIQVDGQELHIRYTHDMSKQPCLKFGDRVLIELGSDNEVIVRRVYRT